jgi:hypothetical protein
VNQVMENPYGDKTVRNYLNAAAFAQPTAGTLGNHGRNSIAGPGFWAIDMALTRLVSFGGAKNLELRTEVFNLTNNFNWGVPTTNFTSGNFGRILAMAGTPRILQFGVKFGF